MSTGNPHPSVSKKVLWVGYIMSAVPVLALALSAVMKFMKPAPVVQGFVHLGYSENSIVVLGILEVVCMIFYLVPRTSVLGAILVTGYFGGATASTYRVGDNWIPTVILGVLVWGGLFLRDRRVRELIPLRQ
jgi:DoxX-like family